MTLLLLLLLAGAEQRTYHPVPLDHVPKRQYTYVETCGLVTYVQRMTPKSATCPSCDGDGDWHITLECPRCPRGVLVVEIVPEIPVPEPPRKGQWLRVRGLRHFDDWHNWYEVRPLGPGTWDEDPFCRAFDRARKGQKRP